MQKYINRQHYLDNKAVYIARASAAKQRLRATNTERLFQYLLRHPCIDCGEKDPVVLEFDHIEEKEADVSNLLGFSWQRVVREISKCAVRCANCHRRITAKTAGWTRYRISG